MVKQKPTSRPHIRLGTSIVLIIGAAAILLAYWHWRKPSDTFDDKTALVRHETVPAPATDNSNPSTTDPQPRLQNIVSLSGQKAGSSVTVDQVNLQKPGYVVIHEAANGRPGKIVASSGLIPAGSRQDLVIRLSTKADSSYIAVLHADDGDKKFDGTKDTPILNAQAQPVMAEFVVVK